jgi:zinc resistance-associated protein
MKFTTISKTLMIIAVVAVAGFAVTSFAGGGWGRGGCGGPGSGSGWGQRDNAGSGYLSDRSDEQIAQLKEERQVFFDQTAEIRDNLYQKNLELRSELAKQSPDAAKAAGLQKEISDLQSQMDQKRLVYRLEMNKKYPDLASSRGAGRGYGKGGQGRGFGQGGSGSCWN